MTKQIIAIIEDELPIRKFLRTSLDAEGYSVVEAESASEGLRIIVQDRPALVILDLWLPDRDGLEIIEQVREWSAVPIIVLSARDQEKDKIRALDMGADDYLTKPFGVGELLARIRVALRTAARLQGNDSAEPTSFQFGHIKVDLLHRRVFSGRREVKLTKLEFDLLKTLAQHSGKVLTHRFLLRTVWGPHSGDQTHYVRVFVSSLRKKLELNPARPRYLLTEQGVGYRLLPE